MTDTQKEYLNYAKKLIKQGKTPTYQLIADHFGRTKSTIYNSIGKITDFKKVGNNCPLCGHIIDK